MVSKPPPIEGFDRDAWIKASPKIVSRSGAIDEAEEAPKASPRRSPKAIPANAKAVTTDKFKKAQLKKLRQVEELKERVKRGETLQEDQLRKIRGEAELRASIGEDAPTSKVTLTEKQIARATATTETNEARMDPKERKRKKREDQKERKANKKAAGTAELNAAQTPKEQIMALLKKMKPPVHVAALSVQYKMSTGEKMSKVHKGGMLRFLKEELKDEVKKRAEKPSDSYGCLQLSNGFFLLVVIH